MSKGIIIALGQSTPIVLAEPTGEEDAAQFVIREKCRRRLLICSERMKDLPASYNVITESNLTLQRL